MSKPDIKALLEAGVHFGHRTEKWNPKMKPFIYESRNGIHVINLTKTAEQINEAYNFLNKQAASGAKILFVGCKKQAQEAIKEIAQESESFYVTERWLGGTLTNLPTIRRSVGRMREIDDREKSGKMKGLPKQEVSALRRECLKLHRYLDGIQNMEAPPQVMVLVDVSRETIAVKEALRLNIPIVALADTNADPNDIDYPIACNDDAIRSIRIILESLGESIKEGRAKYKGTKSSTKEKEKPTDTTKEEMEAISA
ncbi:MAG: 30S ribosomal protein S2 [Verrucomicrobiota bacterium]